MDSSRVYSVDASNMMHSWAIATQQKEEKHSDEHEKEKVNFFQITFFEIFFIIFSKIIFFRNNCLPSKREYKIK